MKMRNKGKVHPTPSSSSSSSSSTTTTNLSSSNKDASSILKLLPAAILALASVLSLEDKEVLAYMITRSIKTTNPCSFLEEKPKKNTKKNGNTNTNNNIASIHKPPMFECECFDCYTSYWCKWDSSPNRELIHQAIEAFEEHLTNGELATKKGRNKKRDQKGRRGAERSEDNGSQENQESVQPSPVNEVKSPEMSDVVPEVSRELAPELELEESGEMLVISQGNEEVISGAAARGGGGGGGHKGLARKVLPDVLGLFNSRLWSLWSPNV